MSMSRLTMERSRSSTNALMTHLETMKRLPQTRTNDSYSLSASWMLRRAWPVALETAPLSLNHPPK